MLDTPRAVVDFLQAALGDDKFMDIAGEYGEPGYRLDSDAKTPLIVMGDYWCRCDKTGETYSDGTPQLHDRLGTHYPHVAERLEENGVQFEWHDEWIVDYENDKAYRCEANSYSWQPSYIMTDDGELLTPDDDLETWVEYVANDDRRCLPSIAYGASDLESAGFTRFNGQFENGWHPGQDDTPAEISPRIREAHGDNVDIVYLLDGTGQFDIAFSAYYRERGE